MSNASSIMRPHRRWLLAIAALLILFADYLDFAGSRVIREYYFKDFSSPSPGLTHAVIALVAVYLLLVALFGSWWLKVRAH
jgi:hypothetical protein